MKTLYVSDLDGTLLRSDETTSTYTNKIINELVSDGMLFSYATARSYSTAHKVTKGLNAKIPLIIYNGAMIVDNVTGQILLSNFFENDIISVIDDLINNGIYPIVYSINDKKEMFSYYKEAMSNGAMKFIKSRKGDPRDHPVSHINDLYKGSIFYITCIDYKNKLAHFYNKYKDQYHCLFQKDIYTQETWLEIMPQNTSKSNAIKQLKKYLDCDYLVVFGDALNDIDMFEIADECYAVENGADELKSIATAVIDNNNNDAVAKFLSSRQK